MLERRSTAESKERRGVEIGGACHFKDLDSFAGDRCK